MQAKTAHLIKHLLTAAVAVSALNAYAIEYPIGTPQQRSGMEIAAVYLQPVVMEPDGMMKKAEESDIHIEADIKAMHGAIRKPVISTAM